MPVPLVLSILCEEAKTLQKQRAVEWHKCKPSEAEMATLKSECEALSPFDPLKLRFNIWEKYKNGKMIMKCSECEFAKVISIVPEGTNPPLEDWGKIFQWVRAPSNGKWTIFWLGAAKKREFPSKGPLDSSHLNGGYTTPCSSHGIFIYRIEEATRVLIHELLHAACLDPQASLPVREATIEVWAELFLIAHRSKGDIDRAEHLWEIQSQWIADTNYRASSKHGVRGPNDYGWRYLNGRENIFKELGATLPKPGVAKSSLRFTAPALD